ncbi:MAG TPA: hypothetical protein VFT74_08415, partial [Isosphaeraceae bacterium]|nr:hypothetical protein [Isosphaeraceae bacterium]
VYSKSKLIEVLGPNMAAGTVVKELEKLQMLTQPRAPGDEPPTDDLVVVFLETHMLRFGQETDAPLLAITSDTSTEISPPSPSVNAQQLADILGEIADYGSTVLLLVDGVHKLDPKLGSSRIDEWIRVLNDRGVAVVTATFNGQVSRDARPDELGDMKGAFAQAVSVVLDNESRSLYPHSDREPYTILDFQRALEALVESQTASQQIPGVFLPDTMLPTRPLLHPRPSVAAERGSTDR